MPKNLILAAVATAILAAVTFVGWSLSGGKFKGPVETLFKELSAGASIGDSRYASKNTLVIDTTCNAATTLLPLEATTTDAFTCTVTGAKAGDRATVTLPSYDLGFGGLVVTGATVSANTVTFTILNNTGAATSSFPLATTSVHIQLWRTSTNP